LEKSGDLRSIEVLPKATAYQSADQLTPAQKRLFEHRRQILAIASNYQVVQRSLQARYPLAHLVEQILKKTSIERMSAYRYLYLLFENGFDESALFPELYRCGGRGRLRPTDTRRKNGRKTNAQRLGLEESFEQTGMTKAMRARVLAIYKRLKSPKPVFGKVYTEIITAGFVTRYQQTDLGRVPVLPAPGTFPNQAQVRYAIRTGTTEMERQRARTTAGNFSRNCRPLTGKAWEGVAGPGYCYAIDSTIGDIHLRSSINRAWIIGRPIVYVVVDVWSTAVVGFYVCLTGPSWATARVALFSTFAEQDIVGGLWGYEPIRVLSPAPTCPAEFMCDRGEYLSQGAQETQRSLCLNMSYNPAYRPDLKGTVEVLHRIVKDEQFLFLPGAIDRRRIELELRTDSKESAYTLREYVQYLYQLFEHHNLFADRSYRLTSEMIAEAVVPSPAGLWGYGHAAGIGYRKIFSNPKLITTLLPRDVATVNREGLYLGKLKYESPLILGRQWTGIARACGARDLVVHRFPGSTSKLWWSDPVNGGFHEFSLSKEARAPADVSYDEWLDALAYEGLKRRDREYLRLAAACELAERNRERTRKAVGATRLAVAETGSAMPNVQEARHLENQALLLGAPSMPSPAPSDAMANEQYQQSYQELLRHALNE